MRTSNNRNKNEKLNRRHIPKLSRFARSMLYILMICFAILSIISVLFEPFSFGTSIVIYVVAALALFSGGFYLVLDIRDSVKRISKVNIYKRIEKNTYATKVATDHRLRMFVFAVPGLISNILYAVFNGIMGITGQSPWFGTLAAYYLLLGLMRILAVNQERKIEHLEDLNFRMKEEIGIYRTSSYLFVVMAVVLFGMVTLVDFSIGGKKYPGVAIYAAAAYTFYKMIGSTIKVIRIRKQNSPLMTIVRRIGHIDACTSILTLQTALFASFASEGQETLVKLMNRITGSAVWLIVLIMGIQGIQIAHKMKIELESGGNNID